MEAKSEPTKDGAGAGAGQSQPEAQDTSDSSSDCHQGGGRGGGGAKASKKKGRGGHGGGGGSGKHAVARSSSNTMDSDKAVNNPKPNGSNKADTNANAKPHFTHADNENGPPSVSHIQPNPQGPALPAPLRPTVIVYAGDLPQADAAEESAMPPPPEMKNGQEQEQMRRLGTTKSGHAPAEPGNPPAKIPAINPLAVQAPQEPPPYVPLLSPVQADYHRDWTPETGFAYPPGQVPPPPNTPVAVSALAAQHRSPAIKITQEQANFAKALDQQSEVRRSSSRASLYRPPPSRPLAAALETHRQNMTHIVNRRKQVLSDLQALSHMERAHEGHIFVFLDSTQAHLSAADVHSGVQRAAHEREAAKYLRQAKGHSEAAQKCRERLEQCRSALDVLNCEAIDSMGGFFEAMYKEVGEELGYQAMSREGTRTRTTTGTIADAASADVDKSVTTNGGKGKQKADANGTVMEKEKEKQPHSKEGPKSDAVKPPEPLANKPGASSRPGSVEPREGQRSRARGAGAVHKKAKSQTGETQGKPSSSSSRRASPTKGNPQPQRQGESGQGQKEKERKKGPFKKKNGKGGGQGGGEGSASGSAGNEKGGKGG